MVEPFQQLLSRHGRVLFSELTHSVKLLVSFESLQLLLVSLFDDAVLFNAEMLHRTELLLIRIVVNIPLEYFINVHVLAHEGKLTASHPSLIVAVRQLLSHNLLELLVVQLQQEVVVHCSSVAAYINLTDLREAANLLVLCEEVEDSLAVQEPASDHIHVQQGYCCRQHLIVDVFALLKQLQGKFHLFQLLGQSAGDRLQ